MKRILIACFSLFCVILAVSCHKHKDCVCKYYHEDKFYDVKVWDNENITEEDCNSMNDTCRRSVSIGDSLHFEMVNIRVECSQK